MDDSTWPSTERRVQPVDRRIIDEKIQLCKTQLEKEISNTKGNLVTLSNRFDDLHSEVVALRLDVHKMTETVAGIDSSLRGINESIGKLSNFPETWQKLVGFWSVMRWAKENLFILIFMVIVLAYAFGILELTGTTFGSINK